MNFCNPVSPIFVLLLPSLTNGRPTNTSIMRYSLFCGGQFTWLVLALDSFVGYLLLVGWQVAFPDGEATIG